MNTLSPTPTEGKADQRPRSMWLSGETLNEARRLQRQGLTLSEIAEELDVGRTAVVRSLYDDRIKP